MAVRAKVPNLVVRRVHSDTFLLEANMKRLATTFRKSKWLAFHMRWAFVAGLSLNRTNNFVKGSGELCLKIVWCRNNFCNPIHTKISNLTKQLRLSSSRNSDIFRTTIMYKYGGTYLDSDAVSIRPLPSDKERKT